MNVTFHVEMTRVQELTSKGRIKLQSDILKRSVLMINSKENTHLPQVIVAAISKRKLLPDESNIELKNDWHRKRERGGMH